MKAPRLPLLVAASLALAVTLSALDLGGLSNALGAASKIKGAIDTAKDAGKLAKGVAGIGPEEERTIGDAVALEVIGRSGGLVRDDAIMRRINLVGRGVARYSDRPDLEWRFAVLDTDAVNAFSAPGGLVFITRGLYEQATTDDVLAGILAHEIAHITNRHALKIVQRSEAISGGKNFLLRRSNKAQQINAQVSQVNSVLGYDISTLVGKLVVSGFDAATEYVADKDAHALAATTGFAPGGLRSVLVQLQEHGEDRATVFATHPPLSERIKRLPDEPGS